METKQPLTHGCYYHIYNRGNNRNDIFFETENYYYFLRLYKQYIDPIAETFAWCLLKNHFHLLIRIKHESDICIDDFEYSTINKPLKVDASRQFSHLFNAYTQAINKKYNRTGSLFEKSFERKLVASEAYLKQLIFYIHNNPVQHGFVDKMDMYPWSSYESIVSDKKTKLKREEVIRIYNGIEKFIDYGKANKNLNDIANFIIE